MGYRENELRIERDCNNGVTYTGTKSNGDIAITIYKDNEIMNRKK